MAANNRRVLFIGRVHDCGHSLAVNRDDIDIDVYEGRDPTEIRRRIADADAIVVRTAVIDRSVIDAGPRLAIISRHGVGYDTVDISAAAERSIPVTITPLANSVSVAEHAMFMLLALAKNARENDDAVRGGRFEQARVSMKPLDLAGRNLLIIGFGRTGSRVAPRAIGFGMRVHAYDPYVEPAEMEAAGCTVVENLHAALPEMDAVSVHTPLNRETRGIVGAKALALMKPTAFVVNTARGGGGGRGCASRRSAGGSNRRRRTRRVRVRARSTAHRSSAPRLRQRHREPALRRGDGRVVDANGGVLGAQRARLLRRAARPGCRREPAPDARSFRGVRMSAHDHRTRSPRQVRRDPRPVRRADAVDRGGAHRGAVDARTVDAHVDRFARLQSFMSRLVSRAPLTGPHCASSRTRRSPPSSRRRRAPGGERRWLRGRGRRSTRSGSAGWH